MNRMLWLLGFVTVAVVGGCFDAPVTVEKVDVNVTVPDSTHIPGTASQFAVGDLCARIPDQVVPEVLRVPIYWEGDPIEIQWPGAQFYLDFPANAVDYNCPQLWEDQWGGCNVAQPGAWLRTLPGAEVFGNPIGDRYICMFFWDGPAILPTGAHVVDIWVPLSDNVVQSGGLLEWLTYGGQGALEGMGDCYSTVRLCAPTDRRCGQRRPALAGGGRL